MASNELAVDWRLCGHSAAKSLFVGYGILPLWFDDDGLLIQKILTEPGFEHIQIYMDRG